MKKNFFIPVRASLFIMVMVTSFFCVDAQPVPPSQPDNNTVMINPHDNHPTFDRKSGGHMMPPPNMPFASPVIKDPVQLQSLLDNIGVSKPVAETIIRLSKNFFSALDLKIISIQRIELDIKEELLKDKPDLKAIQNSINKKSQIFAEIEFLQIKRDLDIKSNLTVSEYDKWKELVFDKSRMMRKMPKQMPKDSVAP